MPSSIGIGIIGFGWMGQAHARSYLSIPKYFPEAGIAPRLVAVADTLPERIDLAVQNFGFESGTTDWRALVEHDELTPQRLVALFQVGPSITEPRS